MTTNNVIVQEETKNILEHPDFLEISKESLLYIVKQDILSVTEVELWKAALAWATHQGGADDIKILKQLMGELLPHLRLLTLAFEDIYDYVQESKMFTSDEIVELSKANTSRRNDITLCSNNMNIRTGVSSTVCVKLHAECSNNIDRSSYLMCLSGKRMVVKSILCHGPLEASSYPPMTSVTLKVYKRDQPQQAVTYSGQVTCTHKNDIVIAPEVLGWRTIVLEPQGSYTLELKFGHALPAWLSYNACPGHPFTGGSISCTKYGNGYLHSLIKQITIGELK